MRSDTKRALPMPAKTETARTLPLLLKVPSAAYELQTSVGHVYDMVNLGKLDLIKIGPKASRITSESIMRVLAQRAKPSSDIPNLKQTKRATAKEAAE